jgi:glycosyltransferase involved in cell wall biosynthesis
MTAGTRGGVWTYALELVRALAEADVEVALATLGAPLSNEQLVEIKPILNLRLFESSFKLEWMKDPWQDVRAAGEWLLALERRLRPDLIHLNGYAHAALAFRAPKLVVAHSCVLSWWSAVKGEAAPPMWDRYRSEVARGLRAADMVISPSKAMLSEIRRLYGGTAEARVIPNGRDPSLFSRTHKERLVFTAGRMWDESKNVAALERIAPDLKWPVCVAGERNHPDGGTAQSNNISYLGRLSAQAMAVWLGKASIYALPARYEPFGLSVLEAALSECALVLGDIPSLRENWEDAAVFVPPDDDPALRYAIEELIRDTTRRKALAARARFRALEFSPRRMAASYLSAYSELMAGDARAQSMKEKIPCAS